jgi:uncharacterized membrane protein HdeD (DUF308 family)
MIMPDTSLKIISLAVGIAIGTKGVARLLRFIRDSRQDKSRTSDLIAASLILSIAIILMIHPKPILSIFPTIVGVGILLYGVITLVARNRNGTFLKVSSIIAIVLGIVVINAPMLFAEATTYIVGAALVTIGIFAIVTEIKIKRALNKISLPPADDYTEVEFKDVEEENKE